MIEDSLYQTTSSIPKTVVKTDSMPLTYKVILWTLVIVVIVLIALICILWDKVDDSKSTIKEITTANYTLTEGDLDKKLVLTYASDTIITIPENISAWSGNIIIQPGYESGTSGIAPPPPNQTTLVIQTEYQLFITELHNGISSYDGMPIDGEVHVEKGTGTALVPVSRDLITYYLNMGFINNKVYIQGLTALYT